MRRECGDMLCCGERKSRAKAPNSRREFRAVISEDSRVFSAIQNLVLVVEKKIRPEKARRHQCLLLDSLGECSPRDLPWSAFLPDT